MRTRVLVTGGARFLGSHLVYNRACPASPIHYQHDPVDTTKTSVVGAINTLDHMLRTFHHTAQHRMTDLCKIVTKNKSDKFGSRHNYTALYDHLFRGSCKSVKTLLEIGIGSLSVSVDSNMRFHTPWVYRIATRLIPTRLVNEVVHSLYGEKNFPIYQPGASLRSWREYFPNAQIFGADVDRSILFNSDRINCCWVDQKSPEAIQNLFSQIGSQIDVIIDDGLHTLEAHCITLENSLPHVASGGWLIVEDIEEKNLYALRKWIQMHSSSFRDFEWELVQLPHPANKLDNNLLIVRRVHAASTSTQYWLTAPHFHGCRVVDRGMRPGDV